jgi:pyruvate/2-oxoglutarate dehydrogenase complex dihydrolipoamide acyltransferase (E2) component
MEKRDPDFALFRGGPAIGTDNRAHIVPRTRLTMATEILLPKIGFSMVEGDIAEWLAADGDHVIEGEPLYLLEADKSTNEVEAPASGTLRIIAPAGETYEVGAVLGVIE